MTDTATRQLVVATLDGRNLDVYLAGPADGEVMFFHSGTPSAPLVYEPMVEQMAARGLRYVAFSRPGYGSSTRRPGRSIADVVDDTQTVLDHLGADRAWILGWSGGGPHALACAALMPERCRGIATIASVAPYPAEGLDYLADTGRENVEEFMAALEGPDALLLFKECNWPIFRAVTGDEIAASLGDLIDEVDRASLTGAFADYIAASSREALRESYWGWFDDDMAMIKPWGFEVGAIRLPVHIWQGRHDRMVPYGHGQWLASHIASAVPHLFDDQGHLSIAVAMFDRVLDELVAARTT
jgi:pimeloyl-ACP methyl ester carboxylesterase